ncbi:type II toxin-antitoxin system VapC family toxin [Paraburkholderia sp.]|uniref:type II toxin-antitoxin system VapC family toxin n=1 Tax=Paraburkholderia sp. TaxID=1926495 RepID=UPI003978E36A
MDTNVLSEVLRPAPVASVLAWLAKQQRAALFTTSITRGEILYGVQSLPAGSQKEMLRNAVMGIFNSDFAGQLLSFDSDAADLYANIATSRKRVGRPISQSDAMIAAITLSRGASLATRNVKDFVDCGIEIIDPWSV